MATQAWPAQGTTLSIDEANNNTFTLINEITSLTDIGGGTVTQAKTTSLANTVHTWRPTIPDNAEVVASMWFDPTDAVHKFLRNLKDTPLQVGNQFKAIFNTGNTVSNVVFVASVSSLSGMDAGDVEDNVTAEFSLKITGAPTWTAAS
jgi:hypothetical protein